MKSIAKAKLEALFSAMSEQAALYIPADNSAGQAEYTRWIPGLSLSQQLNTARSPKDLFFPQVEDLMDFQVSGKEIQVLEHRAAPEDFILFGVRACDCRSFDILDRVFLSEPADGYYADRRKHSTVVTLSCSAPEESCFCGVFGIDPAEPGGDVSGWFAEDRLYLRANTEKGEALLSRLPLEEAAPAPVEKAQADLRGMTARLPLNRLSTQGFDEAHMLSLFNSPQWDALSESCLGCGSCTFVCPTCQCYDVKDFNTGGKIRRFRCWDSCMYSDFTLMSAGQPRPTQKERFRQRFMHKLVYYPANNEGLYSCVGCGRCVRKCPIHMNIAKVMQALGGETHEK